MHARTTALPGMMSDMAANTETVMVIAYDGTHNARRAVHYAGKFISADRAVVLTVTADGEDPDTAQRTNAEGITLARAAGLEPEPLCLTVAGTVWETIVDAADTLDADLIVTGTNGSAGLRSLLHSGVAEHVLRHGQRPVLIVPPWH